MIEIGQDRVAALGAQVRGLSDQVGNLRGYLGGGADLIVSRLADQGASIGHRIDLWRNGKGSSFKIISGDFRPGRALILMDGLRLYNRGNSLETVPFTAIRTVQNLHTDRRASTAERAKGAAIGSLIGASSGAMVGMFSFMRTGGVGAALGGTLGALLAVKHKYQICRITLHDERKAIAVAESTNWLALLASIPANEKRPRGWLRRPK